MGPGQRQQRDGAGGDTGVGVAVGQGCWRGAGGGCEQACWYWQVAGGCHQRSPFPEPTQHCLSQETVPSVLGRSK